MEEAAAATHDGEGEGEEEEEFAADPILSDNDALDDDGKTVASKMMQLNPGMTAAPSLLGAFEPPVAAPKKRAASKKGGKKSTVQEDPDEDLEAERQLKLTTSTLRTSPSG